MRCPRCGQTHPIEEFYISSESVSFAPGYRPVLSGFHCDGWFYRIEAYRVDYEHVKPVAR